MATLRLNPEARTKSTPEQIEAKFQRAAQITGIGHRAFNTGAKSEAMSELYTKLDQLQGELKIAQNKAKTLVSQTSKKKYIKIANNLEAEIEATKSGIARIEELENAGLNFEVPKKQELISEVVELEGKFRLGDLQIGATFRYRSNTKNYYTFLGVADNGEAKVRESNGNEFTAKVLNWKVIKVEVAA